MSIRFFENVGHAHNVSMMSRRTCRREREVQGHRRRPRHRLRGAYPQGIGACARSLQRHATALSPASDSLIRIDVF